MDSPFNNHPQPQEPFNGDEKLNEHRDAVRHPPSLPLTQAGKAAVGIVEWFAFKDYEHVHRAIAQLKELGIREIRTGVSWAEYHREDGPEWFDWYIPQLAGHFTVLPCFFDTPPLLGIEPKGSSPPKDHLAFGRFMLHMIETYGRHFEYVELWNEPDNPREYDFTLDKQWGRFVQMIHCAARKAKAAGKKTVLGGMNPVDTNWLQVMIDAGVMKVIDVLGIHGYPGRADVRGAGWNAQVEKITKHLAAHDLDHVQIWITQAGYSTRHYEERRQLKVFLNLLDAGVPKVYWSSLSDPARVPTEQGHSEIREQDFGLSAPGQKPKLLYKLLKTRGIAQLHQDAWMSGPYTAAIRNTGAGQKHFLITGGAGFIGTNLASHLLQLGHHVTIYDNLSRDGVEKNLRWLKDRFKENLRILIADVRNRFELEEALQGIDMVYHLAAQVAVTTSFEDPATDFDINARGTFNLLDALRKRASPPPLLYTSTNKVYGKMSQVKLKRHRARYGVEDEQFQEFGFDEHCPLNFCSPYGCSKGTADQYVLDFAREQGLKAVVFRMSCIYGPHQCGNEDQGWVAHFLFNALQDKPITIFGDGKQVRDILYVQDLVQAMVLAFTKMNMLSGEAFNIGGGPRNSHSVKEILALIEHRLGKKIDLRFEDWRPGDQRYYVTDFRKFFHLTGWWPAVDAEEGLVLLEKWATGMMDPEAFNLQTVTI